MGATAEERFMQLLSLGGRLGLESLPRWFWAFLGNPLGFGNGSTRQMLCVWFMDPKDRIPGGYISLIDVDQAKGMLSHVVDHGGLAVPSGARRAAEASWHRMAEPRFWWNCQSNFLFSILLRPHQSHSSQSVHPPE